METNNKNNKNHPQKGKTLSLWMNSVLLYHLNVKLLALREADLKTKRKK